MKLRIALAAILVAPSAALAHYGAPRNVDRAIHNHFGKGAMKALRVARCESHFNLHAISPAGYYGLFQFNWGTWRANGGRGHPRWASANEQARVTRITVRRRGWQPWPTCRYA